MTFIFLYLKCIHFQNKKLHNFIFVCCNSQMKILSNESTKNFVQIVNSGVMDILSIITFSVPYMWKWRRDYMNNWYTCNLVKTETSFRKLLSASQLKLFTEITRKQVNTRNSLEMSSVLSLRNFKGME